jgi:hypothetical protein
MILAAFIGGWELLLILIVLGGMAVMVPLGVFAVVYFIRRQQRNNSTSVQREAGQ